MNNHLIEVMRQFTMQQNSRRGGGDCHLRSLLLNACVMAILFIGAVVGDAAQQSGGRTGAAFNQSPASVKFSGSEISTSLKKREERQSGWLYLLDSNNKAKESQVLLVDPERGQVIRTFKTGYTPDMALSPDGTRLYVASTLWTSDQWGQGILQVIDTASGEVLKTVDNPDRRLSTVREYPSDMVFSPNGRWLYISKVHQTLEGDFFYIATFDTARGRFLPQRARLPGCGATLVPPGGQQLSVICSGTLDVRFLDVRKNGAAISVKSSVGIPPSRLSPSSKGVAEHGRRVGLGFLSIDGSTLTVIMGDGRFFKIDKQSRTIMRTDAIDSDARKITNSAAEISNNAAEDWLADSWIRYQPPTLSPNGMKLYVGVGRLSHLRQGVQSFDRIVVFDSQTLKRVETIKPSQPFFSLTLGKDGRHLYAISPEQASIMVIDTATQREIRTIYGIGTSPIWAIVAP
jgi:YVTN family beta-propeller protein